MAAFENAWIGETVRHVVTRIVLLHYFEPKLGAWSVLALITLFWSTLNIWV